MKKQILLLIFSSVVTFVFAQTKPAKPKTQDKIIPIVDIRNQGITSTDKSVEGHKDGDVAVVRLLQVVASHTIADKLDTAEMYEVYFYKTYHSETQKGTSWLQAYYMGARVEEEFDKASYKWAPNNMLTVTLINTLTKNKRKIKLTTSGQTAAVVTETPVEKK